MPSLELLWICISAFIAVGGLLAVLALLMRLILVLFPGQEESATDAAVLAAVTTVMQSVYPGTHVSKVEEIP